MLLIVCAAIALVAANSPLAPAYNALWTVPMPIGSVGLSLTTRGWINDGLMAIFFLTVGLEIKREAVSGELGSPRQAALPISAALGGMIIPAAIYLLVAGGASTVRGWAIPMATDIAFALGALSIAAPQSGGGLRIFLAALAIIDDIGAVLVIAFFYTGALDWHAVQMALICLGSLLALNMLGVRRLAPYLAIGIALWFFVHESGIHATVAAVMLAFTIPAASMERLEHALLGFSTFVVMPLFALANAGVEFAGLDLSRVTLAVVLGLLVGKPLGITGASFLVVRARLASLPAGITWRALHGCGWLGGIGFTMALFIATLAFEGTPLLDSAKAGILAASMLAGVIGTVIVRNETVR